MEQYSNLFQSIKYQKSVSISSSPRLCMKPSLIAPSQKSAAPGGNINAEPVAPVPAALSQHTQDEYPAHFCFTKNSVLSKYDASPACSPRFEL